MVLSSVLQEARAELDLDRWERLDFSLFIRAPLHLSVLSPSLPFFLLPPFWRFPPCVRTNKRPLPGRGISPRPGGPKRAHVLVKRLSGYEFWCRRGERGAMEPAAAAQGGKTWGKDTHAQTCSGIRYHRAAPALRPGLQHPLAWRCSSAAGPVLSPSPPTDSSDHVHLVHCLKNGRLTAACLMIEKRYGASIPSLLAFLRKPVMDKQKRNDTLSGVESFQINENFLDLISEFDFSVCIFTARCH